MTPAEPIVAVQGLAAYYGRTQVLFDVGFEVRSGGVTALLGANGAGKTTTLMALSGLVQREGDIRLCGVQGRRLAAESVARLGVAHVPADRGTFMPLSAEENLLLGAYLHRDRQQVARDLERMYAYFPRLRQRRHQQAGTLSGGEQQMLAIARALMLKPRLMLLDEPSFGLAPLIVVEIFRIMKRINEEEKVSMLLVEQNAALALDLADDAYVLETGRVVMSGKAADVKNDEAIRKSYLGY